MAIHSPNTGIVDWRRVAQSFGKDFSDNGGTIITGFQVTLWMSLIFKLRQKLPHIYYHFLPLHNVHTQHFTLQVNNFKLAGGELLSCKH